VRALAFLAVAIVLAASPARADTTVPPEARSAYDQAESAREEGRLEDAAKLYRQAIELHPLYLDAHVGYLAALRGMGDISSARAFYAELTSKNSDSVELKAFQAAAREPAEAVAALTTLEGTNGDNFRVLLELGRAQLLTGDTKDAENSLKDALKKVPESAAARVLLGDVYLQDGKESRARKEYEGALEVDAAYIPAQLHMALAWHRDGKSEEALKILGKLVAEENLPRLVAGHWLLALVRADMGKFDDAMVSMDKVLSIDANDFQAYIAKGHLLLRQGKPAEAAAAFARAVELNERSSDALYCLGWAYEKSADSPEIQDAQRKERLAKAADAYEKCAAMDPGVAPRDSLGFVYLLGDKHAEAVMQFRRAADIDPKYAPAINNLGLASDIADNRAEAKKRYDTVLGKIDKDNVRARVMLALDLWLDGSATKAIKEMERALKNAPNDDLAWTFLGDIHYDTKKVDKAIKAYKRAVELNDLNFFAWYHLGIAYDEDKHKFEEADKCYEKALAARANPPVDLFLRIAEVNDVELLNRPEKALQYYQHYVDSGGPVDGELAWVPERINELKELLSK